MLYLLASEQAQTRQDVAHLLGVSRNTVGRWLARYQSGGLIALLDIYVPTGKRPSLAPDVLTSIEQVLQRPAGFGSYEVLRQWVERTHHVQVKYKTLYTLVRTRFKAKLKVARPSHTKNVEASAAFEATGTAHLRQALPDDNTRPIKVFAQDESRFGLLTVRRRRLTARGVQLVGTVQHQFQSFYLYGAVAPTTGDNFFMELPHLNSSIFQVFLDQFAQAYPDSLNLLVLDQSGAHTAKRLIIPANVRLVFLPPYSPELNPIERVWRALKDQIGVAAVSKPRNPAGVRRDSVRAGDNAMLQSLTAYAYFVDAVNALCI